MKSTKSQISKRLDEHSAFIYNYHYGPNTSTVSVYKPDGKPRPDLKEILGEDLAGEVIKYFSLDENGVN